MILLTFYLKNGFSFIYLKLVDLQINISINTDNLY